MATPLEELGPTLAYRADGDFDAPEPRLGQSQRVRVRSLTAMQKEALVTSSLTGDTWRLASDEGPYLDGADVAPPPLAFLATGMVSSYLHELAAVADDREVALDDVSVQLDNYYAINGSLLAGTMEGTAFAPDLEVAADSPADAATLEELVETAVDDAPVTGLLAGANDSRFRLARNGEPVTPGGVEALDGPLGPDPAADFDRLEPGPDRQDPPVVRHTGRETEPFDAADEKYTGSDAAGYADTQDRKIHLRATATRTDAGLTHVEQKLYSPRGSIFEFLVDEPPARGGEGRAPDAMSYVATGVGFCFMTQLGRYAHTVDEELTGYRVAQDTHVSLGRADGGDGIPEALPVETDLFLDSPADDEFARTALEMSEQTCYLHALCRTPGLEPEVTVRVA